MRKFFIPIIIGLLGFCIAAEGRADFQKTKIAVLDFQLQGKGHESSDMGQIVAEWLITSLVKEGRFEVVERRLLKKILEEQKLSVSGIIDKNSANQLGRLLGVKVIISGSVLKVQDFTEVNARIIDVESASIIAAESVKSATATRLEELIFQMARKIIRDFPLEGYIVHRKGDEVLIDLGRQAGVKEQMSFVVFKEGEVIKHPKTGEVLDVERIQTGAIRIVQVREKISTAAIIGESEGNAIAYGQMVKSTAEPPRVQRAARAAPAARKQENKARLFVTTVPSSAKVRILNIRPAFEQGMELAEGPYHVEVSAPGYETLASWIELAEGEQKRMMVSLERSSVPAQTQEKAPVQAEAPAPAPEPTQIAKQRPSTPGPIQLGLVNCISRQDAKSWEHQYLSSISTALEQYRFNQSKQGKTPFDLKRLNTVADREVFVNGNPVTQRIYQIGSEQQLDAVMIHHVTFRESQGLVNGWGTDFTNCIVEAFVFDVKTHKRYVKRKVYLAAMDQLRITLKQLTRQVLDEFQAGRQRS